MRFLYIFGGICLWSCEPRHIPSFPAIHLDIPVDNIPNEDKKTSLAVFIDSQQMLSVKVGIEYRGSASRKFPKRSYSLHIRGKGKDSLRWRGMLLQGDWVLYAPYADRTCIRNTLAHELFRKMGHYSPRSCFVELTIDTTYMGLYEWRERIELSPGHVPDANYLLKIDKPTAKIRKECNSSLNPLVPIRFHDSLPGHSVDVAFRAVIRFEEALKMAGPGWQRYADVGSFMDYLLLAEMANSPDAYRSSCYFQVLPDGRLRMGPVWDFDLAFGNSTLSYAQLTTGWRFLQNESDTLANRASPPWWSRLMNRPDFRLGLSKRWSTLRAGILSDSMISWQINELILPIAKEVLKDHSRWHVMDRPILWTVPAEKSHAAEIERLKRWISQRSAWIDTQLNIVD